VLGHRPRRILDLVLRHRSTSTKLGDFGGIQFDFIHKSAPLLSFLFSYWNIYKHK
jgi:hypothetical protein